MEIAAAPVLASVMQVMTLMWSLAGRYDVEVCHREEENKQRMVGLLSATLALAQNRPSEAKVGLAITLIGLRSMGNMRNSVEV
jgi:hypothetical protein